jgi:hypothetical protein
MTTVAGVYDNIQDAYHAIHDLIGHGFAQRDINLIASDSSGEYARYLGTTQVETLLSGDKAMIVGGIANLLGDVRDGTISGIGSVLAAGLLASVIGNGLTATLAKAGISRQKAGYYAEALRRGSTLILVSVDEKLAERAAQIIDRHGPVDFARRIVRWKEDGWSRFDPKGKPYKLAEIDKERDANLSANDRVNTAGVG